MLVFFAFLLGTIVGSFFNAYVWRFGRPERITDRHSLCVHCRHPLGPLDLVPLLSFVWLAGRCRYCHARISWRYPVTELMSGCAFGLVALHFGTAYLQLAAVLALTVVLEALFLLDLRYGVLPDSWTIPGIVLAFVTGMMLGRSSLSLLLGGILGAGFFAVQYALSRGRWIGSGDIRLGALMGCVLGWQLLLAALFLAYLTGALAGLALIAAGRKGWHSYLAFGTFLTGATFFILLYGAPLMSSYARLLGIASLFVW